jgi:hypothetical protein
MVNQRPGVAMTLQLDDRRGNVDGRQPKIGPVKLCQDDIKPFNDGSNLFGNRCGSLRHGVILHSRRSPPCHGHATMNRD